jgi:hypothetical protein
MKLTTEHKLFIVGRLACYDTPKMVADAFKEEFGHTIARQQVQAYDPYAAAGRKMARDLKELFEKTRKRFLKATGEIPVANKAVRLKMLNDSAFAALEKKNVPLMAQLLEQAAKESGEVFTNRHKVTHDGKIDTGTSDTELVNRLTRLGVKVRMKEAAPAAEGANGAAG